MSVQLYSCLGDARQWLPSLHSLLMCAVHVLQDGASALHLAASYGHAAVVQLLLQKHADPNVSSMYHRIRFLYTWIASSYQVSVSSHI